jgi:hypothetical protein
MCKVLSLATEAELRALFQNSKEACPFCPAPSKMGHPQNTATITTNNASPDRVCNSTVKQRRSKAIDMRFYGALDRVSQGQFTDI